MSRNAPGLMRRSFVRLDEKENIVLLGCGWGGYKFLADFDRSKYRVSVVSPRNHFLFTPLLASAAVGAAPVECICTPVRPLCASRNARFYEAKATALNKEEKILECMTLDGRVFPMHYDKLVIGVGFQAADFGIPNLEDHAFFMKETADAKRLHDHILRCFEEASFVHILDGDEDVSPEEEEEMRKLLSFCIVGAGPTGTEFCGELSDFLNTTIRRTYPHLFNYCKVHLIDGAPVMLGPFQDAEISAYAKQHLEKNEFCKVHLSNGVDKITSKKITLKDGTAFDFNTLVWAAGIKPLPFVSNLTNLAKDKSERQLLTDKKCRVKGEDSIFAIGDVATMENFWLPQTAQIAQQQGTYLASLFNSNFDAKTGHLKVQEDYPDFQNLDRGSLAYLGGTAAVYKKPAWLGPFPNLFGILGFFTWRSAYWSMQLSWRNRILLGWSWVFNYVFGRDLTRVGAQSSPAALVEAARETMLKTKTALDNQLRLKSKSMSKSTINK